jgi:hypothetical protein
MRTTWPDGAIGADPGAEALIREARRRQRRRYLAAGLVVLVLATAGVYTRWSGVTSSAQPASSPRPVASRVAGSPAPAAIPPIGTDLLMWPLGAPLGFGPDTGPPFVVDNLLTGRVEQRGTPDLCCGDYQPLLARVGSWLVYVGNGATAIRDSLAGRPRVLGRTSFFVPAAAPGAVWLEYYQSPRPVMVRLASVANRAVGPPITLPAGTQLVRGTAAGLLIQSRSGVLQLWNPDGARTTLPFSPIWPYGFDATAMIVAYGTDCHDNLIPASANGGSATGYPACLMLRVLNVRTGQVSSFPTPPGTAGWVPHEFGLEDSISPRDTMLAARAVIPSATGDQSALFVLRLHGRHRRPTAVPFSTGSVFSKAAWSVDSDWLFYQGPADRLWAYQISSGAARSSSVPCCRYTVMVTVPAPDG